MYKINRTTYKTFPNQLFAFGTFDDFLSDDTYLYLRTYGHEGKYAGDPNLTSFENMIQATIKFVDSVLTPEKLTEFKKKMGSSAIILPVHGFKYKGLTDSNYVFETKDTSSNLMTILAAIKIHHFVGNPISFSCRQKETVTRNASSTIHRISSPTVLKADIKKNVEYIAFDDHIYSGSTVANLVGEIIKGCAKCNKIICLATNPIVKVLKLKKETLDAIKKDPLHASIEQEWKKYFGFGYDGLTEVEANLLIENFVKKKINVMSEIKEYKKQKYVPTYDKSLWPKLKETVTYNNLADLGLPNYGIKIINKIKKDGK